MSQQTKNVKVVFWQAEDTFQAPAKRSQKITVQRVVSATLNWNIQPQNGCYFDNIVFNGAIISRQKQGSADVTQHVIINGENVVVLNYQENLLTWLGARNTVATVSLDVIAADVGQQAPTPNYTFGNLPLWVWAIIAAVIIGLIAWFALKTSIGGKMVSLAYGTTKDIVGAVKG